MNLFNPTDGMSEEEAVIKLRRIMSLHFRGPLSGTCTQCREPYPCRTVRTIMEEPS